MELQHFSHKHPLIFKEEQKNIQHNFCNACQDPVLGPSYICNQCSIAIKIPFILHKSCAELPHKTLHPLHPKHPLILTTEQCRCAACGQNCSNSSFSYGCSECNFNLDLKCASNRRNILRDCHNHKFTILPKKMKSECDVCGENLIDDYKFNLFGFHNSYMCSICQLLVHRDCTSIPRHIKITPHQHPLMLTWFFEHTFPQDQFCRLCHKNMGKSRAVYCCQHCNYACHATCAINEGFLTEATDTKEENCDPGHDTTMESIDDHKSSTSNNLILREASQIINVGEEDPKSESAQQQIKHFSHDQHFLALSDEVADDERNITCDGCKQPITDAFYKCTQQEESCHFFLHKTCAQLPEQMIHPIHRHQLTLLPKSPFTDGKFQCYVCRVMNQGFGYYCKQCVFFVDLQCISVSDPVTHEAHEDPLHFNTEGACSCRGCGISHMPLLFSCMKCDFHLCISCVKLPKTARHRYDNHSLKLTYGPSYEDECDYLFRSAYGNNLDDDDEHYCEICEGKRDPKHWFYYCAECEFDCHPNCILEKYPQVKLGGTYKHNDHEEDRIKLIDKRKSALPCKACGKPTKLLVFECYRCNQHVHEEEHCDSHSSANFHS